jgi:hypothetical protein
MKELAASIFRLVTFCWTTLNAADSCQTLVPVHTASYPRSLESACTISFLLFLESFNHELSRLPLSSFRYHHVFCTSSSLSSGHSFHPRQIALRRNTLGWTWNSLTQNNVILKSLVLGVVSCVVASVALQSELRNYGDSRP